MIRRKLGEDITASCLALFGLFIAGFVLAHILHFLARCDTASINEQSGAGPLGAVNPPPLSNSPAQASQRVKTRLTDSLETPGNSMPTENPEAGARPFNPTKYAVAWIGRDELDPGMQPTEEGLYLRTLGQWQQPDFLELTADEARELLPLDDAVPAALPGNLADVIGGLPTRDDVATAYRNPEVQEKLQVACLLELERDAILSRFTAQPSPEVAQMIEAARRAYDVAEEDLMRALDRDSGYKNWSLLNRLFREFAK